jgi:hypothetical protein
MPGQLNLFAGKKQRGRRSSYKLEFSLHVAVADVLRRWSTPGWRWSHFPAGEWRHPATAARLQRMGLQVGWPDFILLAPFPHDNVPIRNHLARIDGAHFLELKREGATLTDYQHAFMEWCALNAYPYVWCDNFKDALHHLKSWGAVRASVRG